MPIKTIAVWGCGGHVVSAHLPFLRGVRVAGICDPSPDSAMAARRVLGYAPPRLETPESLLALRPEGIIIGSLDQLHPEQLALVVEAGIPVLCEKPLAIDAVGLQRVKDALRSAQAKQLPVASCHQRRSTIADLPYGWVRANLKTLEGRFGPLKRVGLSSIYPKPSQGWKQDRSFLADKCVHDTDYLSALLDGRLEARRELDSYDHYVVSGHIARGNGVDFRCEGTRLHNDRDAYIEYILLGFDHGDCVVYTKTGIVRYIDRRTGKKVIGEITPMIPSSYDRLNREVTLNFLNGHAVHTPADLLANTTAIVALVGPEGYYKGR